MNSKKQSPKQSIDDRLFYHDVLNHTHGLLLFLSHKKELNSEDTTLLKSEIVTLQKHIQNHFQIDHKNNQNGGEFLTYRDFQMTLSVFVESFLKSKNYNVHMTFSGDVEEILNQGHQLKTTTFHRILGNVIKNIAENSDSGDVHFYFDIHPDELKIYSQNTIADKIIQLNHKPQGISSIEFLCSEIGGNYQFKEENGRWVNTLCLPLFIHAEEKAA
jgi:frataxin-like iron-binding protein CyaY